MTKCSHRDDTYYEVIAESEMTDIDDPSELTGWNCDKEAVECQRETEDGEYCVFHSDTTAENRELLNKRLKSKIYKDTEQPFLLIEGVLDRLVIDEEDVSRPIWFYGSKFEGRFEVSDVTMNDIFLRDVTFDNLVEFSKTKFDGVFSVEESTFNESTTIYSCKFYDNSDFKRVNFLDEVVLDRDEFKDTSDFQFAKFESEAKISSCIFRCETTFYRVRFNGETKIARSCDINSVDSDIDGMTRFEDSVDFANSRFSNGSRLYFEINSDADFHQADIDRCDLRKVDLRKSNLENANLEDSILYGVDLRGSRLLGAGLNGVRLDNKTKFLGDPNRSSGSGYDHSVTSILRKKRCYYDPNCYHSETDLEKETDQLRCEARTVYRNLQQLAESTSHSQLQTRAFINRKDMEKERYWSDIWCFNSGPTQPVIAMGRWLRAKISRMVMLYGESPWRVLIWSLGIIISFAILYASLGLIQSSGEVERITLGQLIRNPGGAMSTLTSALYYSSLIFTNLSFGSYSPVNAGAYLTAIETVVGLTMTALFFFVLGRRASK